MTMKKFLPCLTIIFCLFANLSAQQQTETKKKPAPGNQQSPKVAPPLSGNRSTYEVPTDLVFGDASVSVKTSSLVHKVAIAANGVVIVEFPADDAVYSVHPGNQALVELDGLSAREADRRPLPTDPLVFRPGAEFSSSTKTPKSASTLYTIQFVSGLVVTLKFYPVDDLDLNTNRLVLSYSVAEIQKARSSVGLSANMVKRSKPKVLDDSPSSSVGQPLETKVAVSETQVPTVTSIDSKKVELPLRSIPPSVPEPILTIGPERKQAAPTLILPDLMPAVPDPVQTPSNKQKGVPSPQPETPEVSEPSQKKQIVFPVTPPIEKQKPATEDFEQNGFWIVNGSVSEKLRTTVQEVMVDLSKKAPSSFRFIPGKQGLSLAFPFSVGSGSFPELLYAVAVRNDSGKELTLLPDQPDVFVVTKSKSSIVNTERIEISCRLTNLEGTRIAPGQVVLFVVAVNRPPLGVSQNLEITFTQTDAADDPAIINTKR